MKSSLFFLQSLRSPRSADIKSATWGFAVAAVSIYSAQAQTNYSHVATGGNWSTSTQWTPNVVGGPNSVGANLSKANTGSAITTTLDVAATIGKIENASTGSRHWTIQDDANHYALTFDNTGFGNAFLRSNSNTSALTVNANIIIANTDLDISAGGSTTGAGATNVGVLNTNTITATSTQALNFRANGIKLVTINSSIGATGSTINVSNLGTGTAAVTVNGVLGPNVGSVTQNSVTSTLTLSGANTYTGATIISAGSLKLAAAGSIDNTSGVSLGTVGTFDVTAKGIGGYAVNNLTGSGNVTGALTVSTQLAIGNSPGTVNFSSSLTLGAASTYLYELNGVGDTADLGDVAGSLTISSGALLDLVQLGTYTANEKFTLFAYDGALSGFFNDITNTPLADGDTFTDAGGIWMIDYDDTTAGLNGGSGTRFITVTAVPEPTAVLLGGLGMLAILRRRRR